MPAIQSCEFNAAFYSLRKANHIICLVIFICLAVQIGGFCVVEFGRVLECPAASVAQETILPATAAVVPTTAPATSPATAPAVVPAVVVQAVTAPIAEKSDVCLKQRAANWRYGLNWALAATKNIAFAAAFLLFILGTVAGHLSLVGPGVRGIKQIISSVCWAVILLVLLTPWQQVLRPSMVSGATFNLGDIIHYQSKATGAGLTVLIPYYTRFLVYPAVAVLAWLMVVAKFTRGCRRLTCPPTVIATESNRQTQCVEVK